MIGAASGELFAELLIKQFYGGDKTKLIQQQKLQIANLSAILAGALAGSASDSTQGAVTGAQTGKNAVENNSLGRVLGAVKSYDKDIVQKYEAMIAKRGESCKINPEQCNKVVIDFILDMTPIIGDAKAFKEAEDWIDYSLAAIGLIPLAGDGVATALKQAKAALKKGDIATANTLIKEAKQQTSKPEH